MDVRRGQGSLPPETVALSREKTMNKPLVRVEEAAELLAVSRWTIYRWVEQGRLEGTKIGCRSLRVFTRSIEKLVEQNRTEDFQPGVSSSERTSWSGASTGRSVAAC